MRIAVLAAIVALTATTAATTTWAQNVAHGKYIVEGVGLCGDCHTPRDQTGTPIAAQALQGAKLGMQPLHPMPWADTAPKIAGIPGHYTEGQLVTFLQTGKRPDGSPPKPPMPPYRMSTGDARDVAAYLKTLK